MKLWSSYLKSGGSLNDHPSWMGVMYMLAIYDRTLSGAEVLQNTAAGLPNSLPFCESSIQDVVEDVISAVQLNCSDFDADPIRIQVSKFPSYVRRS